MVLKEIKLTLPETKETPFFFQLKKFYLQVKIFLKSNVVFETFLPCLSGVDGESSKGITTVEFKGPV